MEGRKIDIYDALVRERSVRGVIFDIDGVILDSMKIWKNLGARYLMRSGIRPEEGLNEILFSMSMEQGADYMRERYKLDRSREEILRGIQDMLENFYFCEVEAKPGVREMIVKFRKANIPMVAATSSPREHVERALERNGLLKYIDRIFTNSEIGESKHSPKIYNTAAAYIGLKPEKVAVFEDSLYALKTAKEAGYIAIGVYDADGESNQEGMRDTGDIYISFDRDSLFFNGYYSVKSSESRLNGF